MRYNIITIDNFSDIENIQKVARENILERYKVDGFDNYTHGTFAILGKDAVNLFAQKYGYSFNEWDEIKTDGKTRAKLVSFIEPSYYYDARSERGGITSVYNHTKVGVLVEFDGVLLSSYSWDRKGGANSFYLFNDDTDYNKYLPYNWKDEHPEPNRVGTLTDKKLSAWVEWLKARKLAALTVKNERECKTIAFLAKIKKTDLLKCSDYRIGEKSGYMERNGLRYSYNISDNGIIYEKIDCIVYSGSKLEAFNKMVRGNY